VLQYLINRNENKWKGIQNKLEESEARRQEILAGYYKVYAQYLIFLERKRKIEEEEARRKILQRKSQSNTPEKPREAEEARATVRCDSCALDIPEEFLATHLQGKRHKSAMEKDTRPYSAPTLSSPGILSSSVALID
jgi:hypothetical protein